MSELPLFCYLNGLLTALSDAHVDINDRGFRFGDGVFETIRVRQALPELFSYHMQRLQTGLSTLMIEGVDLDIIENHALALITQNNLSEGILRIIISRGNHSHGYLPLDSKPTTLITAEIVSIPTSAPLQLWLSRWQRPSAKSLPTNCKTLQGLSSSLARMESERNNCPEALMLTEGDVIAECSSSTIFWENDGIIFTPSLDSGALEGCMRRYLLEHSTLPIKQGAYTLDSLKKARHVWISNSLRGVCPVVALMPQGYTWKEATFPTTDPHKLLYSVL
jgi:branched-subunit amino acid aminotransferase/4-amino-4-deoxychorismate lyase